jgi:hypothetical protein
MDREQFLRHQQNLSERVFSLTKGEEEARARFEHLAIDTYDFLTSTGKPSEVFSPWPESGANFLGLDRQGYLARRYPGVTIPPSLMQRWQAWNRDYYEMRARNPALELRDMMQHISESNDASSWPDGYERHIQEWVDAGDASAPPPFSDCGIATPEFFSRLHELRQLCGGWLYWNHEMERVVFAPEPEWQRVCAAKEAAEAERCRQWEENRSKVHARRNACVRFSPMRVKTALSGMSFAAGSLPGRRNARRRSRRRHRTHAFSYGL